MAPLESPDTLPEEQSRRLTAPHAFGPYVLLKRLGRGGMGDGGDWQARAYLAHFGQVDAVEPPFEPEGAVVPERRIRD